MSAFSSRFMSMRAPRRSSALSWLLLLLAFAACALMPRSSYADPDFLAPEKAFGFSAQAIGSDTVELDWKIAPGYYMYREQFHFATDPPGGPLAAPVIPPGKVKFDTTFNKDVETYRDTVAIRIPVPPGGQAFNLVATGQGCADAGLCYPPTPYRVHIVPASASGGALSVDDGNSLFGSRWTGVLNADDEGLAGVLSGAGLLQTMLVFFGLGILLSLTPCVLPMVPILSAILVGDRNASRHPRLRGLGLAALYVVGMSVVYTVVGVLAGLSGESIAASLQTPWVLGAFALLLAVLALAMFDVFTLQLPASWQSALSDKATRLPGGRALGALAMGAISALIVGPCVAAPLAGALLYISQTRDVVVGGLALFALAWGMGVPLLAAGASAGALLPKSGAWMDDVKRFFGMLLLGVAWWMLWPVLPTWIQMVGWAVLAILTAALLHAFDALPASAGVGKRMLKGVGILFALIGVLQAVGVASGGRDPMMPLAHLSRVGAADPNASASSSAAASSAQNAGAAGLSGASSPTQGNGFEGTTSADPSTQGSGSQGLLGASSPTKVSGSAREAGAGAFDTASPVQDTGIAGLFGARPVPGLSTPPASVPAPRSGLFERVRSVAELDRLLATSDRPVMLDFYADWCVSCKEMEAQTYPQPAVAQRMARLRLVQADVTANNEDDRQLLKRFKLFGPPGIVFFAPGGQPIAGVRVIGFQGAERFSATLDRVLAGGAR